MADRRGQRNRGRRGGDRQRAKQSVEAPVVLPPSAENSLFGFEVDPAEVLASERAALRVALRAAVPPAIVLGLLLVVVQPIVGIAVGVLAAVAGTMAILRRADGGIASMVPGTVVTSATAPRLANLVDAMVATVGLHAPRLVVVDDDVANACSYGHGESATVVVTRGLLDQLDLVQLEGVLAHELAHLRRGDGRRAAAVYAAAPFTPGGWSDDRLHRALGVGRELRADQVGAASVRYPTGIADALATMAAAPAPGPESFFSSRAFARTRWLWFDPSIGQRDAETAIGNHDATALRLDVLSEW